MNEELEKKLRVVYLKNQLINKNSRELVDDFSTENLHKGFTSYAYELTVQDQPFCVLKDFSDKLQEVINTNRLKFKTSGNVRNLENIVIVRLNQMHVEDPASLDIYKKLQQLNRCYDFKDDDSLYESIAYDYDTLENLRRISEDKPIFQLNADLFLASTNYFLNTMPELYKVKSGYLDATKQILKRLKKEEDLVPSVEHTEKILTLTNNK